MRRLTCAPSIRMRLLGWLVAPILVSGILVGGLAYQASWHEIEEVYDAQLVHFARTLQQLVVHPAAPDSLLQHNTLWHKYERNITYRVWENGQLVGASRYVDTLEGITPPPGFSDQAVRGERWRVFVLVDPITGRRLETAERYHIRYEMIEKLMASLLLPIVLFIGLALLAVFFGVYRNLKPLTHLAGLLNARDEQDLSPLVIENLPLELCPMVDAINRLLTRVDTSLQQEREFAEHAAHELRTPLAALKTQVQVLVRQKAMKPEAEEGLANLRQTLARAEHLVEQLLNLAHLHDDGHTPDEAVDLGAVTSALVEDFMPAARAKKIKLSFIPATTRPWRAQPGAVSALLRNLLDNAIKYTPVGGRVTITLYTDNSLEVADTGPGLTPAQKKKVFGRFVRFNRNGEAGAGIGLAIVQRVVTRFGARITLEDNNPTGLVVKVYWPLAK